MSLVYWVADNYLESTREDCGEYPGYVDAIPVIPLSALTEVVEGLRELHDFFTSNHENVGLELYGRVNGTVLTPSARRLNELLDQTKDLLTQLEAHTKGGGDE